MGFIRVPSFRNGLPHLTRRYFNLRDRRKCLGGSGTEIIEFPSARNKSAFHGS